MRIRFIVCSKTGITVVTDSTKLGLSVMTGFTYCWSTTLGDNENYNEDRYSLRRMPCTLLMLFPGSFYFFKSIQGFAK